jgi:hypothetical protein
MVAVCNQRLALVGGLGPQARSIAQPALPTLDAQSGPLAKDRRVSGVSMEPCRSPLAALSWHGS